MATEEKNTERERELEEENRRLKERLTQKDAENKALKDRVKKLEIVLARAHTTSRNSSKRPSSDIVKPPHARRNSARKIGGQAGHPMHARPALKPEEIDRFIYYSLSRCPDCDGLLREDQALDPYVLQQYELVQRPLETSEHHSRWYWCERCQKLHSAMPVEVEKAGLCGPVLTACIAYLKGGCHASFSTIRKFLRDVLGVQISRGQLAKVVCKVSAALVRTPISYRPQAALPAPLRAAGRSLAEAWPVRQVVAELRMAPLAPAA